MYLYNDSNNVIEFKPKDFKVIDIKKSPVPKSGKPTLIIFYAHWCPHCTNARTMQFVEALGEKLPKKAGIDVGAFSCEHDDKSQELAYNMEIEGFPTFQYFDAKGNPHRYQGPLDIKTMLQFLLDKS